MNTQQTEKHLPIQGQFSEAQAQVEVQWDGSSLQCDYITTLYQLAPSAVTTSDVSVCLDLTTSDSRNTVTDMH